MIRFRFQTIKEWGDGKVKTELVDDGNEVKAGEVDLSASFDALGVAEHKHPEVRGSRPISNISDAKMEEEVDFLSEVQLQAEDFGGSLALPHYG